MRKASAGHRFIVTVLVRVAVPLRGVQIGLLLLAAACGNSAADGREEARGELVEILDSGKVLPEGLPFSEAVRVGGVVYLSGQIGIVAGSMELVPGGLPAESRQTMENIRTSLAAHGYTMRDVVKCTVMLTDMSRWSEFNDIYVTYFGEPYPARTAIGATGLALGAEVEVECIAARRDGTE